MLNYVILAAALFMASEAMAMDVVCRPGPNGTQICTPVDSGGGGQFRCRESMTGQMICF